MKLFRLSILFIACGIFLSFFSQKEDDKKIKILLVGDSTTIGNLPRQVNPEGLHLEQMIEQFAAVEGLPELEVVNAGKGGETARRLLGSKWYNNRIAPVEDVDYIFLRMGINDWYQCKDLDAEFPLQMKALIKQLHQDHPHAEIILATICRFMAHNDCVDVNDLIKKIAIDEKLKLIDIYTPYNQYLLDNGENSLNVRQPSLKSIPEKYHEWLKPYNYFQKGWGGKPDQYVVRVNDMSLDPIFGHTREWYNDRHPNTTGYNLIAVETVKFLAAVIQNKKD